mmetsp:Transcript_31992/g.98732  ORF Transcript_31992/g.98732 Transcript_31992/m.98732 type:complete len:116 (-) Transcript_31992:749-1096(-)
MELPRCAMDCQCLCLQLKILAMYLSMGKRLTFELRIAKMTLSGETFVAAQAALFARVRRFVAATRNARRQPREFRERCWPLKHHNTVDDDSRAAPPASKQIQHLHWPLKNQGRGI